MSSLSIEEILKEIEDLLASAGDLVPEVELAVEPITLNRGYAHGDFGADLRALILSLKYCGNMSEPKIREFLENFDIQISSGSLSNLLTKTAEEFDDIVRAGLVSTPYQQTDDTSARVGFFSAASSGTSSQRSCRHRKYSA